MRFPLPAAPHAPATARLSAVAFVVLAATVVLSAGCTVGPSPSSSASSPSPSASSSSSSSQTAPGVAARTGCGSPVETGPLPEWARAGFSGDSSMPHVLGDHGDIVAAIFGYPLKVTRPDDSSNKILWVSKEQTPPGDLEITATRDGTTDPVQRRVPGGPGPSIIDLPQPGCWHLTLTWSGHTDAMDLTYAP